MSPWYEQAFRRDYLLIYPHRNEAQAILEVEFAIRVCGLRPPAPILDLCCGFGRHSSLFAKKGYSVVGCDLSADLLKEFAKRTDGLPEKTMLVRGDARQLAFGQEKFKAVLSFFQSFGYFDKPSEDRHVIEEAARVLQRKGKFLIDLMNPEYALDNLEATTVSAAAGMKMVQRRRYDAGTNKIIKNITVSIEGGPEKTWKEEVRLYRREVIEEYFRHSGLAVVEWFGDFDGRAHTKYSPRMIGLARKI